MITVTGIFMTLTLVLTVVLFAVFFFGRIKEKDTEDTVDKLITSTGELANQIIEKQRAIDKARQENRELHASRANEKRDKEVLIKNLNIALEDRNKEVIALTEELTIAQSALTSSQLKTRKPRVSKKVDISPIPKQDNDMS